MLTVSLTKDWKEKYYNSLQKLDDEQASWIELESLLRKAVSRLAITAKGLDQRLDQVLTLIQRHVREKKDQALEQDLQELSKVLSQIDDHVDAREVSAQQNPIAELQAQVLRLVEQLRINQAFSERLQQFKASLPNLDREQCIDDLASLINLFLEQQPEAAAPVRNVLLTLVEKIALTHGESKDLSAIKQVLDERFDESDWPGYLDQIIAEVRVIIDGINNEKVELEALVVDVTRQLGEISSVLIDDREENLRGREEAHQLQTLMDDSVGNIASSVESATDLSLLKTSIRENLATIKQGIDDYVAKDEARFHKFEQRNDALRMQIKALEQESEQLKLKLSEDRRKLMFDTLTGARSRLSYEELLEQELSRWARYHEVFSFAILDIDHFKKVNDRFGHNAGDKALQIVARMMIKNVRETDFLFRIGGEEFVLLLPKTELAGAAPLVEKLRRAVGSAGFHFKQEKVGITLSVGLTAISTGDTAESIYERADKALYEAKNSGRDRLIARVR